jgi:hypothetical protein
MPSFSHSEAQIREWMNECPESGDPGLFIITCYSFIEKLSIFYLFFRDLFDQFFENWKNIWWLSFYKSSNPPRIFTSDNSGYEYVSSQFFNNSSSSLCVLRMK